MSMRYGPVELSVPPGFQNILHLISQEVLREKPANTLEFIAEFLDDLLIIRKASGYDPVTHGEMIDRVQEQYWKIVRMRKSSKLSENKMMEKKNVEGKTEICDGSGDLGPPTSVEENADVLVTIAMQQDNGEGTDELYRLADKGLKNSDEEMEDELHLVAEQPDTVAKQHDEDNEAGSAEDITPIQEEGNFEEQDEGMEADTDEQVAMATEEEVEDLAETGEADEKDE